MIKRPTVFVLGAGAGVDIGMPVGETLSKSIANKLNIKFENGMQTSGDPEIMAALRTIARRNQADVNVWRAAGCGIADGVSYTRSIDSFMNAHRSDQYVRTCSKLGIAKTIIEYEMECALSIPQRHLRTFKDPEKVQTSWLNAWMYVLQEQIVHGDNTDCMFKHLSVINFNYDLCIEQFLFKALQDLYHMNEGQSAELLNVNLRIYHPYGSLGKLDWQASNNENLVPFGGSEYDDDLNLVADGIKTFNERLEDDVLAMKLGEEISQAERIVFLGFHFHQQNMQLLASLKPARGGDVEIFATALERSRADLRIVDSQIREMLNQRGGSWNVQLHNDMSCAALFKEYATTLTY